MASEDDKSNVQTYRLIAEGYCLVSQGSEHHSSWLCTSQPC